MTKQKPTQALRTADQDGHYLSHSYLNDGNVAVLALSVFTGVT